MLAETEALQGRLASQGDQLEGANQETLKEDSTESTDTCSGRTAEEAERDTCWMLQEYFHDRDIC